jgi:hypothetical protein
MRLVVPGNVLWALVALLLFASGFLLLHACDLGLFPLFGDKFCVAVHSDALAAEKARMQQLQEQIREAELSLSQKPECGPPPPPPPPPAPVPPPPQPKVEEQLKVPKKLTDLRGCWESMSGDLKITTDDAEHRLVGTVRKCYCFGSNGHGQLKMRYNNNGVKCRAPIVADLNNGKLRMRYPRFQCPWHGEEFGLVPAEIRCEDTAESDAAVCTVENFGNYANIHDERYRRVERDHCD